MSNKIVFPISVCLAMVLLALPYACTKESGGGSNTSKCSTPVTYTNTIKAIIDRSCTPSCHRAGGSAAAQGIFTSYSSLQSKTAAIFREVVERKTMPTTGPLPQADLDAFTCWKENGFKE